MQVCPFLQPLHLRNPRNERRAPEPLSYGDAVADAEGMFGDCPRLIGDCPHVIGDCPHVGEDAGDQVDDVARAGEKDEVSRFKG